MELTIWLVYRSCVVTYLYANVKHFFFYYEPTFSVLLCWLLV
uniref:Uncharacterized protein n=1 Tax=Anguilla anguilla TaxID=7936 RepID=A0A0E9P7V5_ANGAN